MFEFAEAELDVRRTDFRSVLPRLGEHLVGHVDADDVPGQPDLLCGEKAVEACAAAQIEHDLTRLYCRYRLRIAAAKTEIGTVRDGGKFGFRVAHVSGLIVIRGHRATA